MAAQDSPSRTMIVHRDGYDLHARVEPAADAEAAWIVFGNSLVTDLTIWDAQADALAGRFGVLRYDPAGHGRSGVPTRPVDFDDLGADLLAVMGAAGIARAIYVGVSMGVPTGLSAHAKAADRFTALVFSDGQAKTAPGGSAAWAERIDGARVSGMEVFAATTSARWLTSGASPDLRERLNRMIAATPLDGFAACATALKDYDYAAELGRVAVPTLLIAGAEDGAMPEGMARTLQPAIAGARMEIIEGAGHVPCFERPEAFNALLSGFLETVGERAMP